MLMTIDCPACGEPLQVPEGAAGRRAKCNSCQGRFVIPSAEALLESTVSGFAMDEMDQRRREHRYDEGGSGVAALAEAKAEASGSVDGTVLGMPAVGRNPAAGEPGDTAVGVPLTVDKMNRGPKKASKPREVIEVDEPAAYPQELNPTTPRPHLVVRRVSVDGVLLAFDARWLHHDRFRVSVPVRSAFNGESDPMKLTARPMIFLDAVEDPAPRARPLELRYEHEPVGKATPAQMAEAMGRLRGVRAPFDQPILYYAHADASVPAMACRLRATRDDADKGGSDGRDKTVCEVLVPHGRVAAEWLAAVNGRCGEDFGRLMEEVESVGQTAWDALDQKVRLRLEPWCTFQRGERFLAYFNDPDFTASEAGLAGVVVTDKRLIYHKYRRLRSVSLRSPATLHMRKDGSVTRLTITAGDRRAKAGKMPHNRISDFLHALPKGHRLALDAPHLGLSSRSVPVG